MANGRSTAASTGRRHAAASPLWLRWSQVRNALWRWCDQSEHWLHRRLFPGISLHYVRLRSEDKKRQLALLWLGPPVHSVECGGLVARIFSVPSVYLRDECEVLNPRGFDFYFSLESRACRCGGRYGVLPVIEETAAAHAGVLCRAVEAWCLAQTADCTVRDSKGPTAQGVLVERRKR